MEGESSCSTNLNMDQEVMLPGFRFHPTDEELVGFYLKRKIHQRPLSIELIKHVDIYKYDPWDLPKMTATGEKEWYFFCPRDRKYRNSARPNRVTGAGFWKATGTDRPIYSSEGNKCIGLKKSLVFYKGRATKGMKTDWMMHEFRLPSLSDNHRPPAATSNRAADRTIPANDAWAICRIFKKTSSTVQRAISQSWVLPNSTISPHDQVLSRASGNFFHPSHLSPNKISTTTSLAPPIHQPCHFNYNNNNNDTYLDQTHQSNNNFCSFNKPNKPDSFQNLHNNYPLNIETNHSFPSSSLSPFYHLNMPSSSPPSMLLGDFEQLQGRDHESIGSTGPYQLSGASQRSNGGGGLMSTPIQVGGMHDDQTVANTMVKSADLAHVDALSLDGLGDITSPTTWKQNLLLWDYLNSAASPCPSDHVTSAFSMTKCYS